MNTKYYKNLAVKRLKYTRPKSLLNTILILIVNIFIVFALLYLVANLLDYSNIFKNDKFTKTLSVSDRISYVSVLTSTVSGIVTVFITIAITVFFRIADLYAKLIGNQNPSYSYSALLDSIPKIIIEDIDKNLFMIKIDSKVDIVSGIVYRTIERKTKKSINTYKFNYKYSGDEIIIPRRAVNNTSNQIQFNLLCNLNNDYKYVADISFEINTEDSNFTVDFDTLRINHFYATPNAVKKWEKQQIDLELEDS